MIISNIGLFALLGMCSLDDLRERRVKVIEILGFGIFGILIHLLFQNISIESMLGGMAVGLVMFLISVISKEEIGKGDALIFIVTGIYLGFIKTIELLWISAILAGITGGYYMFFKKKNKKYEMPFVPFVLAGFALICSANALFGTPV